MIFEPGHQRFYKTPGQRSFWKTAGIGWLIGFSGLAFYFQNFMTRRFGTLNICQFQLFCLGRYSAQTPKNALLDSLHEAVKGGAQALLFQFPFYAGYLWA